MSSGRDNLVLIGEQPGGRVIRYVGRMREGVRIDRVEAELAVVAGRVVMPARPTAPIGAEVSSLSRLDPVDAAEVVAIILSVPLLVLAIACVNAANLLLVRASRRGREVAIRLALGASRLRLVRQLVTESVILAIGATIIALPLAWAGLKVGAAFMTFPMPLDWTVVAGALVAAFLTALAFGLVPALQASGQRPSAALGTSPAGLAKAAAFLGLMALLLASLGLYGVTAYSVAMRWREIAVRIALGARPERVLAMVTRQALTVAAAGALVGGVAAIGTGAVIQAEVFGATAVDVATLGRSAALLAAAMLLASILPARRAARLDPNAVLRQE